MSFIIYKFNLNAFINNKQRSPNRFNKIQLALFWMSH
ncbi:hypothetical protein M621_19100 [Serratia plymuthica S13]|uniref:Uncharacterized protein n=1 Tax=Serratia plymuthica S13 TaxID=1348660 RepID=S4YSK9_SERPL|nr:hypothetical protein M621_19100 [Serratia plymuthica S13]